MKPACPRIALVASSFSMVMHSNCSSMAPPHVPWKKHLLSPVPINLTLAAPTGPHLTLTYLPRQVAESSPLTDEMNAEQNAKQPNRRYRKTRPQEKRQQ